MRSSILSATLAAFALTGCASTQNSGDADDASLSVASGPTAWTGRLNPTTQRTGGLAGADQARAFGTVTLSPARSNENRTDVRLAVSVPSSANNTSLPWAVLPGRCGTGSIPLASLDLFPPIEIGSNSRGELTTSIALTLPSSGTYHVNVYWPGGGSDLSTVLTCGNLRRGG
ncbi:MAG TPA: hypothetical protein VGE02_04175 [Gemmatimonadales bacterium]